MRETAPKMTCPMLEWEDIRTFLIRRKWIAEPYSSAKPIDPEVTAAIYGRQWDGLSKRLRRELSLFIAGYQRAKS